MLAVSGKWGGIIESELPESITKFKKSDCLLIKSPEKAFLLIFNAIRLFCWLIRNPRARMYFAFVLTLVEYAANFFVKQ